MADYHILESSLEQHEIRVSFHIAVPNEANGANVNLRAALKQYQPFTASAVPWIPDTDVEITQLKAGELYEYTETVCYNGNFTLAQKRGVCDARYTQLVPLIQARIRAILCFWGLDRNI